MLFGDGAGAVVMEPVDEGGFLGFELGADGGGGENLWLPGSGSRQFDEPEKYVKMNGREVFKFATRVMVSSAEAILDECGLTIDDVDVYVPHQANVRIIDHAVQEARRRRREDGGQRRPVRQHVVRARSRSRWPMRPTTGGSNRASWCC